VTYASPSATGSLSYTPVANQSGTAIITVTVQDSGGTANGGDDTIQRTFTVDVLDINDEPTLALIADPADILEDAGLQTVNLTGIATDSAGNETTQTLTVTAVSNNPGLIPNPTVTYTSPSATGSLSYTPVANQSGTAIITVTVQDNGGTANGGDDTIQRTFTVDVLLVNDQPTLDPISHPATINEDAPLQAVSLTGISAGLGGETQTLTVTAVSSNPSVIPHPTVTYTSPNATGSLSYTPVANAFGNGITITVTVQDNGGTANGGVDTIQRTFTFDVLPVNDPPVFVDSTLDYSTAGNTQLRGGDLTPGLSVAHVRDNLDLGEKSTPSDIDGPASFSYSLGTAPANGQATVNGDGTFTYEPNPGFHGPTDTFTVAVSDGGPPPNTSNLTVTVAISGMVWYVHDVVAPANPNNPAPGDDGRSTNAFEVLSDVEPVVTDDDFIFVFRGNTGTTPLDGGIDIDNTGVKLHGEGFGLTVPVVGTLIPPGNRPRITNAGVAGGPEDNGVNVIATAASLTGVEIRGLDISGRDNAVDVTATGANNAGVSISDNTISNDAVNGLEGVDVNAASTGTVTLAFHDNTLTARGTALDFQRTAGTAFVSALHDNVISGDSQASGIVIAGTGGVVTFDATPGGPIDSVPGGMTVIGDPGNRIGGPGLTLSNVTGALNFANPLTGPIAAGDLDIFTDSGAALNVTGGAGGFDLDVTPNAGVFVANAGPAAVVSAADLNMQLNSLTSNNSTGAGVSLTNVTGTFSAPGGIPGSSITNAGTTDFLISGGTANVTYGGTITDDVGQLVSVSGATAGTKSFTGAISDGPTANTGSGISLTGNGGSTISFSGGLALSTGANAAFTATGGGTVTATDTNSTITTTSGTALNVNGTTIGASDLNFRSITQSGGTSAIVLNNTGTVGGLNVTGTGTTTGSGGAISNTSGDAISLTSTRDIVLKNMNIGDASATDTQTTDTTNNISGHGITMNGVQPASNPHGLLLDNVKIARTGGHGINGTGGNVGLSLNNVSILNAGDATFEDAISMGSGFPSSDMLTGTVSITNSTFAAMVDHGFQVENAGSGTLNMTVTTVTMKNNDSIFAGIQQEGSAIQIIDDGSSSAGTPTTNLTVNGLTATNIDQDVLDLIADPGGVINVIVNGNGITANCPKGDNVLRFNSGSPDADDNASFDFDVQNVTVTQMAGTLVQFKSANTMTGSFRNSTLDANDLGNTLAARGIEITADGDSSETPAMTIEVDNVTLNRIGGDGIQVFLSDVTTAASRLDVTIKNSNIGTNPANTAQTGLEIGRGNASANEAIEVRNFTSPGQLYINIASNNIRNFTSANASAQGIDIDVEGTGIIHATASGNNVLAAPGATDFTLDVEASTAFMCADFTSNVDSNDGNAGATLTNLGDAADFQVEGGTGSLAGNNPSTPITTSGSFTSGVCTMPNLP
jgi:hypothetical protein